MSKNITDRWVAIADGDDVGRNLDRLAAANDELGLIQASSEVDANRERIAQWFRLLGATVLLSVADTVIVIGHGPPPDKEYFPSDLGTTWSVGLGQDLAQAHSALAAAKVRGRDTWVDGRQWHLE